MCLVSQMFQERLSFPLLQAVAILELEMSLLKPSLIKNLLLALKTCAVHYDLWTQTKKYFYIFKFWFVDFRRLHDDVNVSG